MQKCRLREKEGRRAERRRRGIQRCINRIYEGFTPDYRQRRSGRGRGGEGRGGDVIFSPLRRAFKGTPTELDWKMKGRRGESRRIRRRGRGRRIKGHEGGRGGRLAL